MRDGPQGRGYSSHTFIYSLQQAAKSAAFPASISDAVGFDDARRFVAVLAREAARDEAKKRRLIQQAQKLLQESALDRNFLKWAHEQRVDVETGRIRRANASNISLLSNVKPVAREGNGCVSVGVSKVIDATEDDLSVVISRRYADQAVVLCVSQDHTCVHAKEVSELVGPPPPQWLVDIFQPV